MNKSWNKHFKFSRANSVPKVNMADYVDFPTNFFSYSTGSDRAR